MKKALLFSVIGLSAGIALGQNIVTTIPQYSSALLEEYTGIHCVFCPDGHKRAKQLKADYPGRVVLANIHTGSYAVPGVGEPDFRTSYGTALVNQTGLTGYPAGSINREVFPGFGSVTALNRGDWRTAALQIMERPSPANIGASTSYNATTRELTINVEVLYTADASNSYNLLNIMLLQDSIPGPQTGGATYNPNDIKNGKYIHAHMLRDMITGQWGDTISNTTAGSLFSKTYTYTLPPDVNSVTVDPDHCHLAVFVTETRQDITQAIDLGIDGQTDDGDHARFYGAFGNANNIVKGGSPSNTQNFTFEFTSSLSGVQDYVFEIITDAPSGWTYQLKVDNTAYNSGDTVSVTGGAASNLSLAVTPGSAGAVATYTVKSYPAGDSATKASFEVVVISGVTDLIVNGSGSYGDGNTYNWDEVYEQALIAAGSNTYDFIPAKTLALAVEENAVSAIENLFLNIGWTFPPMSDDEAQAFMDFLDAGGNIFIAGQDIGWAIKSASGYETATNQLFFDSYLQANYLSDGSTSNSQLNADTSDAIFKGVASSAIVDVYGGNMYPDVLSAKAGAGTIFTYNTDSKKAGVRYTNGTFKTVYLGIGLEMIQDTSVANKIMSLSYAWFKGTIGTEEFDLLVNGVSVFPNPSSGNFTVELPHNPSGYQIDLMNANGQKIRSVEALGSSEFEADGLAPGIYFLNVRAGKESVSKKLIIK